MKSYITSIGMTPWAVINSFWAAVRSGYLPDKIIILREAQRSELAERLSACLRAILDSRDKRDAEILQLELVEKDIASTGKRIAALLESEIASGNEVAIDITSGRRAVISSALMAAWQRDIQHVFYLYLTDFRYPDNPFPMIPMQFQRFVDLRKEVWP